jgi:hypothetical protein
MVREGMRLYMIHKRFHKDSAEIPVAAKRLSCQAFWALLTW